MNSETTIGDEHQTDAGGAALHVLVMSPESFSSHALPNSGTVTIGRSPKCGIRMDDPMASREHARLHIDSSSGNAILKIEDLGSANGTRVRDVPVPAREPTTIASGEGVIIGSTVIMVLQDRSPSGLRRLWSHTYFSARVDEECGRGGGVPSSLSLARVRFTGSAPWTKVAPIFARTLGSQHGVAMYGPKDYEILFLDSNEADVDAALEKLLEVFRAQGLDPRASSACFPRDGRTGDALLAFANAALASRAVAVVEPAAAPSGRMARVRDLAARAAASSINVMIRGETGVGKDVLAHFVHRSSPRATKPFLVLNCGGLPASLLESELFGHLKGTFTGATATKVGLLESADGGTVFLDEIGDMPLNLQVKLLRVIENREILPIGALRPRIINVRFISATNNDLEASIEKGTFRQDLMFRLNGINIDVPPLRQRSEEITVLAQTFVVNGCRDMGRDSVLTLSAASVERLLKHEWPGNIRELKNVIERAIVLCDGAEILPEHLELRPATRSAPEPSADPVSEDPVKAAERRRILDALDACAWSQTRAASSLGMSRRAFVTKLDLYRIPRPQKDALPNEVTAAADRNSVPLQKPE